MNTQFSFVEHFVGKTNANRFSRIAFTLSEVLITLGIIGVVAALTLPTLIADKKEKETVVKLKKFHSTMENAFRLAENDNSELANWFESNDAKENELIFFNKIKPYIILSKECAFEKGCITNGTIKTLDGRDYLDYSNHYKEYRAILSDGSQFWIYICPNCGEGYYGNIKVDIDGFRGKYAFGRDVFIFDITKKGIIPVGVADNNEESFNQYCNLSLQTSGNGLACTAWVIYNENMDYLHCNDLSWDGKVKCK